MERFYTQNDIEKFLNNFRKMSNPYKIEKVHQLLNNPDARARYSVKSNFKPFNFIFMTSAFIIGLSAFLFFSDTEKINNGETIALRVTDSFAEVTRDSAISPGIAKINRSLAEKPFNGMKTGSDAKMLSEVVPDSGLAQETIAELNGSASLSAVLDTDIVPGIKNPVQSLTINEAQNSGNIPDAVPGPCSWRQDTVIDKKSLILELSDKELKAIGITRKGQAFYYHNIIEGIYNMRFYRYPEVIQDDEKQPTYNKFYIAFKTNSRFEPTGSGDFYSSMDTLVPVIISNDAEGLIFWFTPHQSFFDLLPERYKFLEAVYKNLICLKKQNPGRSFTNYLDATHERILDPVNILNLTDEELRGIGVIIDAGSVKFHSRNNNYTLELSKAGTSSTGNSDDFLVFPRILILC